MLSSIQAQAIVERFKAKFPSPDAMMSSYDRYEARIPAPNRSPESFERWLSEDADQQHVRAAVMSKLDATAGPSQNLPLLVDDCPGCCGKRLVRRDLSPGHAEFGKLALCPQCGGRPTRAAPRIPTAERLLCYKCGQFEDESAHERCTNPKWHSPNWTTGDYPHDRPVPGWKTAASVLP